MGLGDSLRKAMERLKTSAIDKQTIKEAIKDLQRALISTDVEVKLVLELSKKIEDAAFKGCASFACKSEKTGVYRVTVSNST